MKYLLDTNVLSELVKPQPNRQVVDWVDSLDPATIFISVITLGEIRKGVEKTSSPERKELLVAWLHSDLLPRFDGKIAPITPSVALLWGELVGRLEQAGRPLAALDSLIAAIALDGGYTIATRNEDDFAGTGAAVINPWHIE
jgi:toxin FitB